MAGGPGAAQGLGELAARPVIARALAHPEALDLEQGGDEPVTATVEDQVPQAFAPERAEGAAAVLDRLPAERIPDPVGDTGGEPANPGVPGRPVDPPAGHRVPPVQMRQHSRDVVG